MSLRSSQSHRRRKTTRRKEMTRRKKETTKKRTTVRTKRERTQRKRTQRRTRTTKTLWKTRASPGLEKEAKLSRPSTISGVQTNPASAVPKLGRAAQALAESASAAATCSRTISTVRVVRRRSSASAQTSATWAASVAVASEDGEWASRFIVLGQIQPLGLTVLGPDVLNFLCIIRHSDNNIKPYNRKNRFFTNG